MSTNKWKALVEDGVITGDQVTTVFVRQGKYAAAPVEGGPEPDVVLGSIAEFAHLDLAAFAQGVAHVAG